MQANQWQDSRLYNTLRCGSEVGGEGGDVRDIVLHSRCRWEEGRGRGRVNTEGGGAHGPPQTGRDDEGEEGEGGERQRVTQAPTCKKQGPAGGAPTVIVSVIWLKNMERSRRRNISKMSYRRPCAGTRASRVL